MPSATGIGTNINRTGNVLVGGYDNGAFTPYHAFYHTDTAGVVDIGTLDPSNNASRTSFATDVSSDGSVIVGYSGVGPLGYNHAFRWTQTGGMVALDPGANDSNSPPQSLAFGVSGDGGVIVGQRDFKAFRWTQAGGFLSLGSSSYLASAVNVDGSVVVGQIKAGFGGGAFRWTEAGGLQNLGFLPGDSGAMATGMSDDGSIVVGISSTGFLGKDGLGGTVNYDPTQSRAFYWTAANGMQDLTQLLAATGEDLTNITLVAATGISASGTWIGGAAVTPDTQSGETTAFVASLTATLPLPGDYNQNGIVDAADYTVWRDSLGRTGTGLAADGNGNNQIDNGDYTVWKSNFGQHAPGAGSGAGASANAAIPEPATIPLMAAAFVIVAVVGRRRWKIV